MTLSILIWLPLAISLLASLLPGAVIGRGRRSSAASSTLGVAISFVARFKPGDAGLQFVTDKVWISSLGIHYKLGLDGLNVALVVLTTVLFSASLLWASMREWERPRAFYFWFGLAESAVLGAFCAQDLALFVAFFDLMLIPFYFLTGMWGTGDRVRATTKLVVYTLVGSFLMLVGGGRDRRARLQRARDAADVRDQLAAAPAAVAHLPGLDLPRASPPRSWSRCRWSRSTAGCADGYKSMPIPAVAVFSGVLSKVAAYGFLRIVLPLFPYASVHFQMLMLLIALVSILWATAVAFTTTDARLVVAYSSVAQLGFITLGIFSLQPHGRPGRAAADGQPRARDRAAVLHRRRARRPRRRLGEAARHGRDRLPRPGARGAVPDRRRSRRWRCPARRTSSASS